MAKIVVDYNVVSAKSESLKNIATSISTLLNEMKSEINKLKTAWEGEAAETLVNKFMSLSASFDERYQTVIDYSAFLNKAAEQMKATELAAKQGAESQANKA